MTFKGLKVGLEIHQQLAGKKLFCNCPAEICDEQPDLFVLKDDEGFVLLGHFCVPSLNPMDFGFS